MVTFLAEQQRALNVGDGLLDLAFGHTKRI
jgi:hypothetical protein